MSESVTVVPYVLAYFVREKRINGEILQEILLSYRSHTSFGNGNYSMIGGKIDDKESLKSALVREVAEEIGIVVAPEDISLSHVMHFQGATRVCIAFVFTIAQWTGEPVNKEANKHDHIRWFDLQNLPSNILPRHLKMIQSIQRNELYSDEGLDLIKKVDLV